jgi:Alkylmercury lyase
VTNDVDRYPPELAVGVTSSRLATVSAAAREVHRAILRSFAATGHPPETASLVHATPADCHLDTLLAELHDRDVIRLHDEGGVWAAYPFSAGPTAHMVAIAGGPTIYAMCAIDALGVAGMLGRDTAITSTDPGSGEQVRVSVHNGRATWHPDTAVVFVGSDTSARGDRSPSDDESSAVPAADRCCGVMNFFPSLANARSWLADHPEVSGVVLGKEQALRLGVDIFGRLLDD